jgi:hypothetical protein
MVPRLQGKRRKASNTSSTSIVHLSATRSMISRTSASSCGSVTTGGVTLAVLALAAETFSPRCGINFA